MTSVKEREYKRENMLFYLIMRLCAKPFIYMKYKPLYLHAERMAECGVVFAPNHRKTVDSLVLVVGINRAVHWAALKRFFTGEDSIFENSKNPLLCSITKFVFSKSGMVSIDRDGNNVQSLLKLRQYLQDGEAVGLFPEGTTNKELEKRELGEIKEGAFLLVENSKAVIQPIAITWYAERKHKVIINFRTPIKAEKGKKLDQLVQEWKDAVYEGIRENNEVASRE